MSTWIDDIVGLENDLAALSKSYVTQVRIPGGGWKTSEQPSLVVQLRRMATSNEQGGDQGNAAGKPVVSKMPVQREDALSLAIEIEKLAERYVKYVGASAVAVDFTSNCEYLSSRLDELQDAEVKMLRNEFSSMRHKAELLLEWEEPEGYAIGAKCPRCKARQTLRAFVDWNTVTRVMCTKCEAVWGADDIGELSGQIKKER